MPCFVCIHEFGDQTIYLVKVNFKLKIIFNVKVRKGDVELRLWIIPKEREQEREGCVRVEADEGWSPENQSSSPRIYPTVSDLGVRLVQREEPLTSRGYYWEEMLRVEAEKIEVCRKQEKNGMNGSKYINGGCLGINRRLTIINYREPSGNDERVR
ncbi:18671_t:CDS:2 [Acaulospora morrowiae]|uniref:18671_t:CDS:1 n=1 Tax=Acaulospora morrowiae TaxID=94023 RepID=A0A9N9C052_9GLOM|nr:18671_t:CDS:2 [Acaulospora morrowiae]